jgi:hypothetical protein
MEPIDVLRLSQKDKLTKEELEAIETAMLTFKCDQLGATLIQLVMGENYCDHKTAKMLVARWRRIGSKVGDRVMALLDPKAHRGMVACGIAKPYIPDNMDDAEEIWKNNPPPKKE